MASVVQPPGRSATAAAPVHVVRHGADTGVNDDDDILATLLRRGEALRDEMAIAAYDVLDPTGAADVGGGVQRMHAYTDALLFGGADSGAGDLHAFVPFPEEDAATLGQGGAYSPPPARGQYGANGRRGGGVPEWLVGGLDDSGDVLLEDEGLLNDLFYSTAHDGALDLALGGAESNSDSNDSDHADDWRRPASAVHRHRAGHRGNEASHGVRPGHVNRAPNSAAAVSDVVASAKALALSIEQVDLDTAASADVLRACVQDHTSLVVEYDPPPPSSTVARVDGRTPDLEIGSGPFGRRCVSTGVADGIVTFDRTDVFPVHPGTDMRVQSGTLGGLTPTHGATPTPHTGVVPAWAAGDVWCFRVLLRADAAAPVLLGVARLDLDALTMTSSADNAYDLVLYSSTGAALGVLSIRVDWRDHYDEDMTINSDAPLRRPLTFHVALYVRDCTEVGRRDNGLARNLYLVCRTLSAGDETRTDVHWEVLAARFQHKHTVPVLNSDALMDKLRNGCCVIEVWDRCARTDGSDALVGIVKTPLHEFYQAFNDHEVLVALLRSDLPVVAASEYRAIYNPLENTSVGELHVHLAMGSCRQVTAWLQRVMRDNEGRGRGVPGSEGQSTCADTGAQQRTLFDNGAAHPTRAPDGGDGRDGEVCQHIFEVRVTAATGVRGFEGKAPGESDCFVQFYFPENHSYSSRNTPHQHVGVAPGRHGGGGASSLQPPRRQPHRTPCTLAAGDMTFDDAATIHVVTLPGDVDVEQELYPHVGEGVVFEAWERFQFPTAHERLVATFTMPWECVTSLLAQYKDRTAVPDAMPEASAAASVSCVWKGGVDHSTAGDDDGGAGTLSVELSYRCVSFPAAASSTGHPGESQAPQCYVGGDDARGLCKTELPVASPPTTVTVLRGAGLRSAVAATTQGLSVEADVGVSSYVKLAVVTVTRQAPGSNVHASLAVTRKSPWHATAVAQRSFRPEFHETKVVHDRGMLCTNDASAAMVGGVPEYRCFLLGKCCDWW